MFKLIFYIFAFVDFEFASAGGLLTLEKINKFIYVNCAHYRWKARSQAILSVLKNFGADFLCLQVLFHLLSPFLWSV